MIEIVGLLISCIALTISVIVLLLEKSIRVRVINIHTPEGFELIKVFNDSEFDIYLQGPIVKSGNTIKYLTSNQLDTPCNVKSKSIKDFLITKDDMNSYFLKMESDRLAFGFEINCKKKKFCKVIKK